MLQWKRDGYYVEIGAFDPFIDSNTLNLDKEYGWKGFGVEIREDKAAEFKNIRSNPCLAIDATIADYRQLFIEHNAPKQIDYLQLDIEPAEHTLAALMLMPLEEYRFSVITFEHDLYFSEVNHLFKNKARFVLESYGYQLVAEDINHGENKPFEDWYVDPTVIPESIWALAVSQNVEGNSLFE